MGPTVASDRRIQRFRKKPVEIDAIRNEGEWPPIMAWLDELAGGRASIPFGARPAITRNQDGTLNIETLEGTMRANVGDWLICGVKGEFYPCKPDVFGATYEPVESAALSGDPLPEWGAAEDQEGVVQLTCNGVPIVDLNAALRAIPALTLLALHNFKPGYYTRKGDPEPDQWFVSESFVEKRDALVGNQGTRESSSKGQEPARG